MWRCYMTEICINLLSSIIHVIGKTRGHFILSFHGLYYHHFLSREFHSVTMASMDDFSIERALRISCCRAVYAYFME